MSTAPRIFISVGERSGDIHGHDLILALKARNPDVVIHGNGGDAMIDAGLQPLHHIHQLAIMGFVDIFWHFFTLRQCLKSTQAYLSSENIDTLVLVDYGGFNLRLAKYAHQLGIRVVYYITPKVWAWRPGRIKKIKSCVDFAALILPFEEDMFKKAGIPCQYVGNPTLNEVSRLPMSPGTMLGLMPGSRKREITTQLPLFLQAAQRLEKQHPDLRFLLILDSEASHQVAHPILQDYPVQHLELHIGHSHEGILRCRQLMITSGTATLEAACLCRPMAIVYKTHALTYYLIKHLITVRYIGLPNLLCNEEIVPELIQHAATAENIADTMQFFLNEDHYQSCVNALTKMRQSLDESRHAAERTSAIILQKIRIDEAVI